MLQRNNFVPSRTRTPALPDDPMIRFAVICTLFCTLLGLSTAAQAAAEELPWAYLVRLDISRDGQRLPPASSQINAGESTRFDLDCPQGGILRVHQRVTAFPGTQGQRALVELELFRVAGRRSARLVAPTLGVWLGQVQVDRFRTDMGLIEVRATVVAVRTGPAPAGSVSTGPADLGLSNWLNPPARPVPLI